MPDKQYLTVQLGERGGWTIVLRSRREAKIKEISSHSTKKEANEIKELLLLASPQFRYR